jgi:hypothetical protein
MTRGEHAKRFIIIAVLVAALVPVYTTVQAETTKDSKAKQNCWERKTKLAFGPSARIGPNTGAPYFDCPNGAQTAIDYWDKKCGPTPEDCGCKMVVECSKPEHIKRFNEYIADKEALACFTDPALNNPEAHKCYEKLIKKRQGNK